MPTEGLRDLINMTVHLCGIAIERHRTEQRIAFMAHHDVLTGLPNRTMFDSALGETLLRARDNNDVVTLAFLDLDEFKLINDSLGHHVGGSAAVGARATSSRASAATNSPSCCAAGLTSRRS